MNEHHNHSAWLAGTLVLAFIFWIGVFSVGWGVFWLKIALAALILAIQSVRLQGWRAMGLKSSLSSVGLGVLSAALLYAIFWLGKSVSTAILPFASDQIASIYSWGEETPKLLIMALLLFITGPCEEIYWRGFVQRQLMLRFGGFRGWFFAAVLYGGVHLCTANFMLIGAAFVAGAFWGLIYWRYRDLTAIIISHSLWSTFIFAVVPL